MQLIENIYVISRDRKQFEKTNLLFEKHGFENLHFWKDCRIKDEPVVGCSVSHYSLVKFALETLLPYIVVFEDDAVPCNDAYDKTLKAMLSRPKDCTYLVLGWVASDKQNINEYDRSTDFKVIAGSHAYALFGKEAYEKYIAAWENNGVADHIPTQIDTSYKVNERLFCQYTVNNGIHLPKGWAAEDFKVTSNAPSNFSLSSRLIDDISQEDIKSRHIAIAYTVDIQGQGAVLFINLLCNSIYSIKNSNKNNDVSISIFYGNISEQVMDSINCLKDKNFDIVFRHLSQDDLKFMLQFTKQDPTSSARAWCGIVYARLWLAKQMLNEDRCLYLDSDTMVRKDLYELYSTDMGDKSYGMVMGCIPEYGYNSGVILMDLKKIREANKWEALNEHLAKYAKTYFLPDLTVINRFYKDDIFELPLKYNYPPYCDRMPMPNDECSQATIWHFYNGNTKPYAFTQADWCKVNWNNMLNEADQYIRNIRQCLQTSSANDSTSNNHVI